MKLLWLCNLAPGAVMEKCTGKPGSGLWTDHVLADLRRQPELNIHILCRHSADCEGSLDDRCSFRTFQAGLPHVYLAEQETFFARELKRFQPDVIHIWGTEYAHTLAMVRAAKQCAMAERVVVSIQGLCSIYAGHFAEGIPMKVLRRPTLRDRVRHDSILHQQQKFARRGQMEIQALENVGHIIGRTAWDKACALQISPGAAYHHCNETLRQPFYEDAWCYEKCTKHRIFAPSCVYSVKGFHYLLEAFAEVLRVYPDATLAVPGKSFLTASGIREKLRQDSYHKYLAELARQYGVEDRISFLGKLSPEGMKNAYLQANVFAMPSTIENSPNSLGEAMLLGAPCVAADVGGVTTMMKHETEGFAYQSTAPYMLAYYIKKVFAMEGAAEAMGAAAQKHARKTHDPAQNLEDLLAIYRQIGI